MTISAQCTWLSGDSSKVELTTSPLQCALEVGDLLGALVDEQDDELHLGEFSAMEFAMFCMRTVLPVRGGATMRPRWPKPIGVMMSTMRMETSFCPGISSRMR
jgi:hypothetical protein